MQTKLNEIIENLKSNFSSGPVKPIDSKIVLWLERVRFKMSPKQRAELYDMLAALVTDGKPLDTSLRELRTRYVAKKRPLAAMLGAWLSSLDEGSSFSDALKGYAAETEGTIIAATEKSGDLADGFNQAAGVARSSAAIRGTLISEMTTPAIQILMLFILMIGFSTSMAPQLMQSVPLAAMDDSQRSLFELAGAIEHTWMYMIGVFIALAYFTAWTVPRYTGRFRPILDKLPPWSIYRIYSSATFMISLAALIKAGIPIESAIRFVRQQSGPYMRSHLSIMIGRMRAGLEQGESMDTGLLSDRVSDMVAIYSTTSDFDRAIGSLGKTASDDGLATIKKQASVVKTASMMLIGFFVAWILTSVMAIGDAAKRAGDMPSQTISK